MTYQPAVGAWTETAARRLLWAAKQVLIRLEKTVPEDPYVEKWALKLEQELVKPVNKFKWAAWYRKHTSRVERVPEGENPVVKADDDPPQPPDVPDEFRHAWEALPALVRDRLYRQAGEIRTSALGLPFDPQDLDKGVESTMRLIRGIPDSARERLRALVRAAYEDGGGPEAFERYIKREWAAVSTYKARQIAVTEWNRAASVATRESYLRQGVDRMRWYTAGDDRVCEICEANAAEMDIPITQMFFSGDFTPPAHPGCRCDVSAA